VRVVVGNEAKRFPLTPDDVRKEIFFLGKFAIVTDRDLDKCSYGDRPIVPHQTHLDA
jgi:hypothetical protein